MTRMARIEEMKHSAIWQNIGEVAVQTGFFALPVHLYAHLRPELRFPDGTYPVSLK